MKNIIFSAVIMAFVLMSCDEKPKETTNDQTHEMENGNKMMDNDTTMHDKSNTIENHEEIYACSMHPEVIGKKDEKCSKCGMKLTEPVKASDSPE